MNPTPHVHADTILLWANIVASGEEKAGWWKLLCNHPDLIVGEPCKWIFVDCRGLWHDGFRYKIEMTKHHPNFTISQEWDKVKDERTKDTFGIERYHYLLNNHDSIDETPRDYFLFAGQDVSGRLKIVPSKYHPKSGDEPTTSPFTISQSQIKEGN